MWFQAQCAHYGLSTHGTLAALRNQLDVALESGGLGMPEEIKRAEWMERGSGPCEVCERRNAAKEEAKAVPVVAPEPPAAKSSKDAAPAPPPAPQRKALSVKTNIPTTASFRSKYETSLFGAENKTVLADSNKLPVGPAQDPVVSPISPRGILVGRSNAPPALNVSKYGASLREEENKPVQVVADPNRLTANQNPVLSPISPRGILVVKSNAPSTPKVSKFNPGFPGVAHLSKSVRWDPELEALEEIKLRMGFPEQESDTETESDYGDSSSASDSVDEFVPALSSSPLSLPYASLARHNQLGEDVVSGRWSLRVTCHTMLPLPGPWRAASSNWLMGDLNVLLSSDGRSLSAEFALLGMDGVIKSRKFEPRREGVCAWVKFVAQMPIITEDGRRKHACVFGPSEMQYGYLRFGGDGKVRGMLRCRRYGRLEFAGARVGRPIAMRSSWEDFVA